MPLPGDALPRERAMLLPVTEVPGEPGWLAGQSCPVIAYGEGDCPGADVVVADSAAAAPLLAAIERQPVAALVLVQVLRAVESLSPADGLAVESLAYGLLQSGAGFRDWLAGRPAPPSLQAAGEGEAIVVQRDGATLRALLNRPATRNAIGVEMRDALVALFELVALDDTIERLELRGAGRCFSTGGALAEFGLVPAIDTGHEIRSMHNPARLLAAIGDRVCCHLHGACIGSGIELPAFAGRVTASRCTFFQLPELSMGLIPGAGGCVSLTRRMGRQRTAWLVLGGRRIKSETALRWGLIDAVVD